MRCRSRWSFGPWEAAGHVSSYCSDPILIGSGTMQRRISFYLLALVVAGLGSSLAAQRPATDSSLLTVDRIFGSPEFRGGSLGSLAWLSDGVGYTTLEPTAGGKGGGQDIVRYDAETGLKTILVPAARLGPGGGFAAPAGEEKSWWGR